MGEARRRGDRALRVQEGLARRQQEALERERQAQQARELYRKLELRRIDALSERQRTSEREAVEAMEWLSRASGLAAIAFSGALRARGSLEADDIHIRRGGDVAFTLRRDPDHGHFWALRAVRDGEELPTILDLDRYRNDLIERIGMGCYDFNATHYEEVAPEDTNGLRARWIVCADSTGMWRANEMGGTAESQPLAQDTVTALRTHGVCAEATIEFAPSSRMERWARERPSYVLGHAGLLGFRALRHAKTQVLSHGRQMRLWLLVLAPDDLPTAKDSA